jgi:histidinol dehydrogenase
MNIIPFPARDQWPALLARPVQEAQDIEAKVIPILEQVKVRVTKE